MGTEVRNVPEAAALDAGEASIGRYLARQRELRGITLEELATRTKIPIRSLARLESGAFDQKPDGFARGFVRTVALALGLDADEAVTRLLAEPVPDAAAAGEGGRSGIAIALLVVAALLIALVLWLRGGDPAPATAAAGSSRAEWVLRSDPVRSLAAAEGELSAASAATPDTARAEAGGAGPAPAAQAPLPLPLEAPATP